jgi:hypothetical protein
MLLLIFMEIDSFAWEMHHPQTVEGTAEVVKLFISVCDGALLCLPHAVL